MHGLNHDVRHIDQEIRQLDRDIDSMHLKVHQYLMDRSKHPHPRHEVLIHRIINYQIRGLRSRELELRLESLQFKAFNRARIWKQWFEDDAKGRFRKSQIHIENAEGKKRSEILIDRMYLRTKDQWSKYGVINIESRDEFKKRILPQLEMARKNLRKGQKIILSYDKNMHTAHVRIEEE